MPFSPFRGVYDEEKIAFLTNLIATGVRLTSPAFDLDSAHQGAISKALRLAYQKKAQQAGIAYVEGAFQSQASEIEIALSMDDFVAELGALTSDSQYEAAGQAIEELI